MPRILYVEDNEDNIYMLSRRLKKKNFEVVTATDGAEGVEKAKTQQPDLILMDLSLPVMDGWTATKIIKSDDKTKHIPVIALSAHAMDEHKDSAIAAGCDDYDTKPVDFKRLLSKIEPYLKRIEP